MKIQEVAKEKVQAAEKPETLEVKPEAAEKVGGVVDDALLEERILPSGKTPRATVSEDGAGRRLFIRGEGGQIVSEGPYVSSASRAAWEAARHAHPADVWTDYGSLLVCDMVKEGGVTHFCLCLRGNCPLYETESGICKPKGKAPRSCHVQRRDSWRGSSLKSQVVSE